jgi:LmbE family N-acetylglucosaminyl deacetylase
MTAPQSLELSPATRLMILAPHPDDESLGTGGLIQQAIAAGAAIRTVFVTDGDNNPWPQRYLEHRWTIGPEERRRWGARRRREAIQALATLGLGVEHAVFLGMHDTEVLPLWTRRDKATLEVFDRLLEEWRPTLLALPWPRDRHPDHRGTWAFTVETLRRRGLTTPHFSYVIHRPWFGAPTGGLRLQLSAAQQAAKRRAIQCHETQMALSRGRFTSFAKPEEIFTSGSASAPDR